MKYLITDGSGRVCAAKFMCFVTWIVVLGVFIYQVKIGADVNYQGLMLLLAGPQVTYWGRNYTKAHTDQK